MTGGAIGGAPERARTGGGDGIDEGTGAAGFCGHCGEPVDVAAHPQCEQALRLEPPRYCPQCRRRMAVQVTPRGWSAACSRHGERRA